MAAASCVLTEDQFLCPICLDVFTDPVTTTCGHNFCKSCITQHWENNGQYKCPMCIKKFHKRPELQVNTFISEMTAQFRLSTKKKYRSSSEQQCDKTQVPCDICAGTKLKALKSCLVCLASYCEKHLEPHLTASALRKHQLVNPVKNLEGRMCKKHNKPLELFCKNDQMCICMLCTVLEHKMHNVIRLNEEREGKKAELGKTKAEIQKMIQRRQLKIQDIKHSVELSDEDADREVAAGVQIYNIFRYVLDIGLKEINETIEVKKRMTREQAKGFITELEQEISQLMRSRAELEQLSHAEDDLDFLQTFPFLNVFLPTKDWTKVSIPPPIYEGTVKKDMDINYEWLGKTEALSKERRKLSEAELRKVQQYAVNVTLNPNTAHRALVLSNDEKQVRCTDEWRNLPDNPERFSIRGNVLGRYGYSSGKFYYQVHVEGKNQWGLGVARQSVNRKTDIPMSPKNGYWQLCLKDNEYKVSGDPPVPLSLKSKPKNVGVFVDYEEGLVSFYDTDAIALIYSFTGCFFTEKLYPCLNPCFYDGGKNSTPLIITPVTRT
ncbi:E3 ubiquitin-protein ligase TRIM21-like [Seriola lalandi dorsalis]|uniref:E3 ubiquitin-protein ligase TRIM21-like n=1 Tax=Seriola lalandi dorsalis TaxID=1841481 RepID=A0A3B4X870_SERLL|nr:E3 ubiquitin-protein ligase TRIM21-like [Seriola lalandi dorsalis]